MTEFGASFSRFRQLEGDLPETAAVRHEQGENENVPDLVMRCKATVHGENSICNLKNNL